MSKIAEVLEKHEAEILNDWINDQLSGISRRDLISETELKAQSTAFLREMSKAAIASGIDTSNGAWSNVRSMLNDISTSRATQGFTPTETATFVMSLKQPLIRRLRKEAAGNADHLFEELWNSNLLIDRLALYTTDAFIKIREQIIARQQEEMLELSTPVVKLWDGILALPLIGTLDSARTQVVMESLLNAIVETNSLVAIIDITGVPTVDTLVAQHLLKTVTAARLMGAECIISGVRPQIAQTIVHLGINLVDVITKSNLADAFALALQRSGRAVVRQNRHNGADETPTGAGNNVLEENHAARGSRS
ncbi:MAG TPA: STAS domain-containing protein [Candidatus Angelobacter sp.]|nr:STAS domain-containing protein [Candidatus Angelobacter sp.]